MFSAGKLFGKWTSACGFTDILGAFKSTVGGLQRTIVDKQCKIRLSAEEVCEEF